MKRMIAAFFAVLLLLSICVFLVGCGAEDSEKNISSETESSNEEGLPWENGGKKPTEYNWDEFSALTGPQQIEFQNSFNSTEEFDDWMNKAKGEDDKIQPAPWENGGKKPADYTWDEFLALSGDHQIMFQNSFGSIDEFDKWMINAQDAEE